jgi:hypothetical protein
MKLAAIFKFVGLNAEQIRAVVRDGARFQASGEIIIPPEVTRVICPVCRRPVGKMTCRPIKQST